VYIGGDGMLKMWLVFVLSLVLVRFYAGYDSSFQNNKFIVIKNPKIRKILVDETLLHERKKRPKQDINKITISGLVLYLFALVTLIASIVCYFNLPQTPVEAWEIESDGFFIYVDTLNEKISAELIWIYFICMVLYIGLSMFKYCKVLKKKGERVITRITAVVMILVSLACGIYAIIEIVSEIISI